VTFEGETPAKRPAVNHAVIFGSDLNSPRADVKPDGSFDATLPPGHHTIDLLSTLDNSDYYVKSIRSGNQDILRNGFTLAGSEQIETEIVLVPSTGRIEGIVTDAEGKPVLGAA
jgi:hypothetical protein